MITVFATHGGCVQNTGVVDHRRHQPKHEEPSHEATSESAHDHNVSGLGGQLGKLIAAVNIVGWNHHQVPPQERVPSHEK